MAAELTLSELRRELKSLNPPPERLAACVERQEFEALLTEMRAAPSAQQPAPAAATTTTAAPTTTTPAAAGVVVVGAAVVVVACLLYTSPSPRDGLLSRMPSSA